MFCIFVFVLFVYFTRARRHRLRVFVGSLQMIMSVNEGFSSPLQKQTILQALVSPQCPLCREKRPWSSLQQSLSQSACCINAL